MNKINYLGIPLMVVVIFAVNISCSAAKTTIPVTTSVTTSIQPPTSTSPISPTTTIAIPSSTVATNPPTTAPPTTTVTMPPITSATPINGTPIFVQGETFTPETLIVFVGTTVTWKNFDAEDHTATSVSGEFDGYLLASIGTFSYTFTKAGTYNYYCTIHPYMTGTIIVK